MTQDWKRLVERWTSVYGCRTLPGVPSDEWGSVLAGGRPLPATLQPLYEISNGLRGEGLILLPVARPTDLKRTWDSIQRANDPEHSRFLQWDLGLLEQFLVVADIGGESCAAVARIDGSFWYEDDEGFHQTTLSLEEFIERALMDAAK